MDTLKKLWSSKVGLIIRSAGMVAILAAVSALVVYFSGFENQELWVVLLTTVLKAIQKTLTK